ncbi:MAG: SDR family oxidoreductase [Aquisalinus sp.]|nr:SDR family oxidoreductase [Aquisalinus sp.]
MTKSRITPNRRQVLAGAATMATAASLAGTKAAAEEMNFAGQSVLITGTSSGFGKLAAQHLARHGATVIASMRNVPRPEAEELRDLANDENLKLSVVEIDVTKPEQIASGVAEAESIAGGALDVLINNAGIAYGGPIEIHDEQSISRIYDVNLHGYHRMAKAVLPKMRAASAGHIFNVSSQLGRLVLPNLGLYCSTKFAVEAMFEAMAYELAPFGVEVTIIQPGGYPTKIWENGTKNFEGLLERVGEERVAAYEAHLTIAQGMFNGSQSTDPMDIPRAIAEIMAMPAGTRPLRRAVHPNTAGPDAVNGVAKMVQAGMLGNGPYASWHKSVSD